MAFPAFCRVFSGLADPVGTEQGRETTPAAVGKERAESRWEDKWGLTGVRD